MDTLRAGLPFFNVQGQNSFGYKHWLLQVAWLLVPNQLYQFLDVGHCDKYRIAKFIQTSKDQKFAQWDPLGTSVQSPEVYLHLKQDSV